MSAVDDLTEPLERAGAAERVALASKWKERADGEALPDPGKAGSVSSRAGDAGVFWAGQAFVHRRWVRRRWSTGVGDGQPSYGLVFHRISIGVWCSPGLCRSG
ncbi:hypothetical protein [Pseudonocardia sp. T1-2H]|uniref:hypothetical protein n=1 Tax=Pseudonocardia sp. T1-2H TaxID=3128899 RepID=UPI003100D7B8